MSHRARLHEGSCRDETEVREIVETVIDSQKNEETMEGTEQVEATDSRMIGV